jgi:hypothetical protein
MDGGNGPVRESSSVNGSEGGTTSRSRDYPLAPKPGMGILRLQVQVPGELKYLINYYKNRNRMPNFGWAVRTLLETHPDLAKLAAELYTVNQADSGQGTS